MGMGMQSTLGHLAGNRREKGPNFRLFLSLSHLLVSLLTKPNWVPLQVGLPGTELVERGGE